MGFNLYRKDKVKFEIEGSEIVLHVKRLPAKASMQVGLKVNRLQDAMKEASKEEKEELSIQIFELHIDLLAEIVEEIEGLDGLTDWPEDTKGRKAIFEMAGIDFVITAVDAYNESKTKVVDENPKG